jgi:endonuclease YncB( thermonuclease family)
MKRILWALTVALATLSLGIAPSTLAATQANKTKKTQPAPQPSTVKKAPAKAQPGKSANAKQARAGRGSPEARKQAGTRRGSKVGPRAHAAAPQATQRHGPVPQTSGSSASPVVLAPPSADAGTPAPATRRARPVSNRAYAIDGESFFHNGRKIHIQGVDRPDLGQANNEVAKQRLQALLDSGELNVQPVATDESGRTVAVVRVNGRDVSERLRTEGVEQAQ